MKYLLSLLLIITVIVVRAQCDQFDNLLNKGDTYLKGKKPNYQEAINAYTAAILACSDRAGEAQKRLAKMVSDINRLKENAVAAERKATEAEKNTKKALADLEIQKARTDSALAKAEKLVNAFYFYGDRFALAYKDYQFYFIDKNGDPVEQLGEYDKAEQFDNLSFAKVREHNRDYLLDTLGTTYTAAYTMADLDSNITALDFRDKQLDSFPIELFHHPQLRVIILNGSRETTLSSDIANLHRLKSLYLIFCHLSNLPWEIGQLKNLQTLDLHGNQLTMLPKEIGQLKNLQTLDLSKNKLTTLPKEIGQLTGLQRLNLGQQHNFSLSMVKKLWITDGSYSELIPIGNNLTALPSEFGQLKSLHTLDLSGNRLDSLPTEIGQLKNLKVLNLRDNQLITLHREIGQSKNLQSLNLFGNQLSSLPAQIRSLKSLTYLDLRGNPFSPDYIEQLRKDMPWCEIKF